MTSCSVSQKIDTELGQAPTSQARPRDTDHLRPSNFAARTLSLVEHTFSKFSGDPCPVRRVLSNSSYLSLCAKSTFFPLLLNRTREGQSLVWVSTQRDNLFCFLFSGTIIVCLIFCFPLFDCVAVFVRIIFLRRLRPLRYVVSRFPPRS